MIFIGLAIWLLFCLGVAWLAAGKGRNGWTWFFLSLFLTPLAGLVLIWLPAHEKSVQTDGLDRGNKNTCRHCGKMIEADAKACPQCKADFYQQASRRAPPTPNPNATMYPETRIMPRTIQTLFNVSTNGQECGELETKEVRDLIKSHALSPDDLYYDKRLRAWVAIRTNPQLYSE